MQNILDYAVYIAIRFVVCIVQAMPLDLCAAWARMLAVVASDILQLRSDVVDDNLLHAFPSMSPRERRLLARRMWEHLFLMGIEVVHAPRKIHDTNWRDFITLLNAPTIMQACFDERPTVMISGHYGNFELSGYMLGLLGFPSFTVARTLDNRYLDRFVNEFRGRTGQYIISKRGSAAEVEEILKGGGVLALLGDQYAGRKGCWVEFFGRPASSHKAVALFSLSSNAPTLFCYARRLDRPLRHQMGVDAVLDPRTMPPDMRTVPDVTRWFTRRLEHTIRQAPEQYWWVHRRWREPPQKKPRRTKAA